MYLEVKLLETFSNPHIHYLLGFISHNILALYCNSKVIKYFYVLMNQIISGGRHSGQRPPARMSITKETNIDEPLTNGWNHGTLPLAQKPQVSQPVHLNPGS